MTRDNKWRNPKAIVECEWLFNRLGDEDIRAFDCTTYLHYTDDHPSKPNPSMIKAAMDEANVDPNCTVMIGDTSFDVDMAKSAGVFAIGVGWGYHPHSKMAAADILVHRAADLLGAIDNLLRE